MCALQDLTASPDAKSREGADLQQKDLRLWGSSPVLELSGV